MIFINKFTEEEMLKAHTFTSNNYGMLIEKQNCRCIYCKEEFCSTSIREYTMDYTALCPNCSIDAVIGEKSGYVFDDETATQMYKYFFENAETISSHAEKKIEYLKIH